jgi:hypothetical protein
VSVDSGGVRDRGSAGGRACRLAKSSISSQTHFSQNRIGSVGSWRVLSLESKHSGVDLRINPEPQPVAKVASNIVENKRLYQGSVDLSYWRASGVFQSDSFNKRVLLRWGDAVSPGTVLVDKSLRCVLHPEQFNV